MADPLDFDVSILIVNWNTEHFIVPCVESILRATTGVRHEIIVVDNASSDGSVSRLLERFPEDRFPNVRILANRGNRYFAGGNNQALEVASGRNILILNPDTEIQPGAIETLCAFAEGTPDAGMVSAKLFNPDGSYQPFYGRLPSFATVALCYTDVGRRIDRKFLRGWAKRRLLYGELGEIRETRGFDDGGAGFACTLVRRDVIEAVGFMDERFPIFFNDGDLGNRLFKAGYRAYVVAEARVTHHLGSAVSQLTPRDFSETFMTSLRRYLHKHHGRLFATTTDLVFLGNYLLLLLYGAVLLARGRKTRAALRDDWAACREILSRRSLSAPAGRRASP